MIKRILPLILVLFSFSSCRLYWPNMLFRDTKDFIVATIPEVEYQKQLLLPFDKISFQIYTQDGIILVDPVGGEIMGLGGGGNTYTVKEDGYVELPLLGEVYVEGITRLEFESFLERKYSAWYNEPYIQLQVTNHRAYVFMGIGSARVISLPSENTKLIEVLASMGGISADSKSNRIKIIRGDKGTYDAPRVKRIDFSTIKGLKDADFIVLPDDIIVVDPKLRPAQATIQQVSYLMAIVSTISTLYLLVLSITKQ
jgi:polysaccharide export outer membrane protein